MWLFSLGENFAKMLSIHFTWGNFHDTTHFSFIKAYGFYFTRGGNFGRSSQNREKREDYPHAKISTFTVVIFPGGNFTIVSPKCYAWFKFFTIKNNIPSYLCLTWHNF